MRMIPATPELCPPSRRSLIAGVVSATIALTAPPAVAIGERTDTDSEFLALFAEWQRAFRAARALPEETPEEIVEAYWKRVEDLRSRMNGIHVYTPAGAASKAKYLFAGMTGANEAWDWAAYDKPIDSADFTDDEEVAMLSLILDIERLTEVRHG